MGYHVADVLVDGVSVGAVAAYTFTNVTAGHTIAASFAIDTYTITASAGANGAFDPSGAVVVAHGADQAFTITPSVGYHVADVLVDGVSVGAVTAYTFTNVTAGHTIAASFAIDIYTITAFAGANGAIDPSGQVAVAYGADQAFAITPSLGYHVADVLVDGVSVGAVTAYTFTNVTALRQHTRADSVICVTDARHLAAQLRDAPEAVAQLAQADLVLVNKADLVKEDALAVVEIAVERANPTADVLRSVKGDVPIAQLLRRNAFNLSTLRLPAPRLTAARSGRLPQVYFDVDEGRHGRGIDALSLSIDQPLNGTAFIGWLQRFVQARGADLLRGKGVVCLQGSDRRYVFQSVHMTVDSGLDRPWLTGESRGSRLVFIGRDLDREQIREQLQRCVAQACEVAP